MSERDTYADVGVALRASIERAHQAGCTRKELRALLAVIAMVAAYSRLEDRIYVADVARVAKLHIVDARSALRSLRDKGVIVYEGKRSDRSLIGLPATSDLRGDPASYLRGDPASFESPTREAIPLPLERRSGVANEAESPLCTEKTSEKTSEKSAADWIDSLQLNGNGAMT